MKKHWKARIITKTLRILLRFHLLSQRSTRTNSLQISPKKALKKRGLLLRLVVNEVVILTVFCVRFTVISCATKVYFNYYKAWPANLFLLRAPVNNRDSL